MTSGNAPTKAVEVHADKTRTKKAPKPSKRGSKPKYPWDEVEQAFIEGIPKDSEGLERTYLNLKDLAEHYDIPYQRVRERSSLRRWTERRHAEQTKLVQLRQKKRMEKLATEATEFDSKAHDVAKMGMGLVYARIAEIASDLQTAKKRRDDAKARMEAGEHVERFELFSAVNYKEMEGLSRAAETFQNIGRRALGTDVERHEISGPGGGPIELDSIVVAEELVRDDSERLAALLDAMSRAGLADINNIIEGEVLSDTDEEPDEQAG